jgi:hypothetical protein
MLSIQGAFADPARFGALNSATSDSPEGGKKCKVRSHSPQRYLGSPLVA